MTAKVGQSEGRRMGEVELIMGRGSMADRSKAAREPHHTLWKCIVGVGKVRLAHGSSH